MSQFSVHVSLEVSPGKGEDSHCDFLTSSPNFKSKIIAVFDGLGGRTAGFDNLSGGQIASREASKVTERILKQWNTPLTQEIALELQKNICQTLREQADAKMRQSRLRGQLAGKRLCTTLALASIPQQEKSPHEVNLAWIGDSRIYFLSPTKGLQQLTSDDLEIERDAFEMIREDPPMSQFLTADFPENWRINFTSKSLKEDELILACTDGCFQYLTTPWDFEKLLLETLSDSNTPLEWQQHLTQKYETIKQDDISLLLFPIGSASFDLLKESYQNRYSDLTDNYNSEEKNLEELQSLWQTYKVDYEAKLKVSEQPSLNQEITSNTNELSDTDDYSANIPVKDYEGQHEIFPKGEPAITSFVKETEQPTTSEKEIKLFPVPERNKSSDFKVDETNQEIAFYFEKASNSVKYGRYNQAISEYRYVISLNPENEEANLSLGQLYIKSERFDNAIPYLKQVLHHSSKFYFDAISSLAEAYYHIRNYKEATSYFNQIQESLGDLQEQQVEMYANSLIIIGKDEEALKLCEKAHTKYHQNYFICELIGEIKYKENSLKESEKWFEKSYDLCRQEFIKSRSEDLRQETNRIWKKYKKLADKKLKY